MSSNYFAIERNGNYWDHVVVKDTSGNVMFENYLKMTYDEMKSSVDLEEFVVAIMDASGDDVSGNAIITLIGDDDVFIWSIMIGLDEDGDLRYVLVDWKKDGKRYRYES
jgi:hypothetical protein